MDIVPAIDEKKQSALASILSSNQFLLSSVTDPSEWIFDNLGIDLYDNQIEFVDGVTDLSIKNLVLIGSRGGGKTYAVIGALLYLCDEIEGIRIGVFAPKWPQATRLIKEVEPILKSPKCPLRSKIDWDSTVKTRLQFKNGSFIQCSSANEMANIEGDHYHVIVIDEAHMVPSISVSQKIEPMLGSFNIAKMIKIGVAMYDNHFYKSFMSRLFAKIIKPWTECPVLLNSGSVIIDGKEYPSKTFDLMPLPLRQQIFPGHPELYTDGNSGMEVADFLTNYMMIWARDVAKALSDDEQKRLVGDHVPDKRGFPNEIYVFGCDFAQGSPTGNDEKLDYTALAVWKVYAGGVKQKVFAKKWKGNPLGQIREIIELIHPSRGVFPCRVGMIDYSNVGSVALGAFQEQGVQVTGIMFKQTETNSGKNYKNAMYDNFKYELSGNRVKYPAMSYMAGDHEMNDGYIEWCQLERREATGINKVIEAPENYHDDMVCADLMALFISTRGDVTSLQGMSGIKMTPNMLLPMPSLAHASTYGNNPSLFMGRILSR